MPRLRAVRNGLDADDGISPDTAEKIGAVSIDHLKYQGMITPVVIGRQMSIAIHQGRWIVSIQSPLPYSWGRGLG